MRAPSSSGVAAGCGSPRKRSCARPGSSIGRRCRSREGVVELRPARRAPPSAALCRGGDGAAGAVVELPLVTAATGERRRCESFTASFEPGAARRRHGPVRLRASRRCSALLAGLDVPDEGEVVIGGTVISALDREARARFRRDTSRSSASHRACPGFLTARENVELGLAIRGCRGNRRPRAGDRRARRGRARRACGPARRGAVRRSAGACRGRAGAGRPARR